MEIHSSYCDLSIMTQKVIDIGYFLEKIKSNGYENAALDIELLDQKSNINTIKNENRIKQEIKINGMKILKRITLVIQNTANLYPLSQQQIPYQCDILAIKPVNQKIFHSICTEYENYDIISFDIGYKIPFMLKRNPIYQAINKGKYFQICYDMMYDQSRRVIAMTNIVNIIKATGGKNLITSSHASDSRTHRTPYDVAALLISLGLDKNKALATLKQNCHKVINSGQHRLFLKGSIKEIPHSIGVKLNKRIQKHCQNIKKKQKELSKQMKQKAMVSQNK